MSLYCGSMVVRVEDESERMNRIQREWDKDVEDEDEPLSLRRLCLINVAENMRDVWTQDYTHNYMGRYFFRYIVGPFNLLPGELIEELLRVLSQRKLLSRAALHLLLLPQLRALSLSQSCNLITAKLCSLIAVRCPSLKRLDLSGALYVSSVAMCSLLSELSCLQSLSVAGTMCDGTVIKMLTQSCLLLQHLDVSRCLHLPPSALLPLALQGTKRLTSLQALDIRSGEDAIDSLAAAAFLLVGAPALHRLAIEDLGLACAIIQSKDFAETDDFSIRENLPCLEGFWHAMRDHEVHALPLEEETDRSLSIEEKRMDAPGGQFKLRLREVQGVTLYSLDAVSSLCPDLSSISLNCNDYEDSTPSIRLTRGLARWSGQLHFLSLQFSGPLSELVPPLQVCGFSLLSLMLEGVQADGNVPLIALLHACPKLTVLSLHMDPPRSNQEDDDDNDDEDFEDCDLPRLPHLRTLTLMFSSEERRLKPVLYWTSLKSVLWSLLRGSAQLRTLFLIAVPCRLDSVFRLVLDHYTEPLQCLRRISLKRSDVNMKTVTRLVNSYRRLTALDVSECWALTRSDVNKLQRQARGRGHKVQIIWT